MTEEDQYLTPWGEDQAELERVAIASSWDDPIRARELLKFPSSAWLIGAGRAEIVEAIRGVLNDNHPISELLVGHYVQKACGLESTAWREYEWISGMYRQAVWSISSMHGQALKELRESWEWNLAARTLNGASSRARQLPFAEWYHLLMTELGTLQPEGEIAAPTFDQVMLERIKERLSGEAEAALLKTGLPALDDLLGNVVPGQMILIVAPPGMAKTTFAFQIAANLSKSDEKSLFVQLEMGAEEMADRAICMAAKKPLRELTPDDIRNAGDHAHLLKNIVMLDQGMSLEECERRVRAWLYTNKGAKAVLTDYAGLLQDHGSKINPVNAANAVSDYSKRVAKLHGVVHFLLQQPSKQYDMDKKPALGHIRDSGKFRQDADKIIFLHHPHFWDQSMPRTYLQAWILKNRGGRADQIAHLYWQPGQYLIRDWPWEVPSASSTGGGKRKDVADALRAGLAAPVEMDEMELPI